MVNAVRRGRQGCADVSKKKNFRRLAGRWCKRRHQADAANWRDQRYVLQLTGTAPHDDPLPDMEGERCVCPRWLVSLVTFISLAVLVDLFSKAWFCRDHRLSRGGVVLIARFCRDQNVRGAALHRQHVVVAVVHRSGQLLDLARREATEVVYIRDLFHVDAVQDVALPGGVNRSRRPRARECG